MPRREDDDAGALASESGELSAATHDEIDAMLLAMWQARPAGKAGLSRDVDLRPSWEEALRERGLRSEWKAVLARFNQPEHQYMHNLPGRRPKASRRSSFGQ